jgi:hypothetical protein
MIAPPTPFDFLFAAIGERHEEPPGWRLEGDPR